jgi:hypothetical protein
MRLHPLLVACVALLPSVAAASKITITTDPVGAVVQLDGVSFGPSPVTIPKVSPGAHQLRVSAEGYVTREDLLDVDGSSDFQIHAPLNPAPKKVEAPAPPPKPEPAPQPTPPPAQPQPAPTPPAAPVAPPPAAQKPLPVSELPVGWGTQKKTLVLLVETVPADAYVQVVGMEEVKRAPATFTGFAPGIVRLRVRAPNHKEKHVEVDLKHDARTRVTLEKLP